MNTARFFELAHKVIDDRATDDERAELAVIMARNPMLKEELELLRKEARAFAQAEAAARAKDPEVGEEATAPPELTEDERWRSAEGRQQNRRFYQRWQWWVRLAVATTVGALFILSDFKSTPEPIIQVAMVGKTELAKESGLKNLVLLRQEWRSVASHFVDKAADLPPWEKEWPTESTVPMVKLAIDQDAKQVRVSGRSLQTSFERIFAVEKDLPTTLNEVNEFLKEQFHRQRLPRASGRK